MTRWYIPGGKEGTDRQAKPVLCIFYAHSAQADETDVQDECREIARIVEEKSPEEISAQVIPGRHDFQHHFKGDWDAWTSSVSQRLDVVSLEPVYDLIVVPNEHVGRATAAIVNTAVKKGFPVFLFKDSAISRITQVKIGDPDDWQGGFELDTLPSPSPSQEPWSGEGTQLELPLIHKEDPRGNSDS